MLSERPFKFADQKTERGKVPNPEYNIFRDQPIAGVSPLRINTLLSTAICHCAVFGAGVQDYYAYRKRRAKAKTRYCPFVAREGTICDPLSPSIAVR